MMKPPLKGGFLPTREESEDDNKENNSLINRMMLPSKSCTNIKNEAQRHSRNLSKQIVTSYQDQS